MSVVPRPDVVVGDDGLARCAWGASDPDYRRYHDEEWGTPQHDPVRLFEKVCLEGFQSGLSWITILRRRPAFREVFHDVDFGHLRDLLRVEVVEDLAERRSPAENRDPREP